MLSNIEAYIEGTQSHLSIGGANLKAAIFST
jgi:hypothetical protein